MRMIFRTLASVVFVAAFASVASAQIPTTPPSPAQAQQMLQNNPALIQRLQQMMQSSGLTPDQIRERLKAQGYPESLLDQYLPGGNADSTAVPGDNIFAAVRALGIGDSTSVDSLSLVARGQRRLRVRNDSAFLDTLQKFIKTDTTGASAIRALLRSRDLQREQLDSGFTIFASDLFNNDSKLFEPTTAAAADPNYRFGAGDKLVLILTGEVEKSYPLTVTKEGFVVIPDVGRVDVAGLTRTQLEDALYRQLGRVYSGVRRGPDARTHFYIDISQMGANQVFVNGDVKHPNSYQVSRAATAMTALYLAGGPTPNGSMRDVQIRRGGQTVATFDVYDYALRGDASKDVRLENGDIVFVPPRGGQVRVAGDVIRPATYEVKGNETVADVVQMAGGFAETADRRRVQIERVVPAAQRTIAGADRREVDVPGELLATERVQGGDLLRITAIARRVTSRVDVKGNVWTEGPVALTPGMHLYDALRHAGGLKPDSYLGTVLVTRLLPDSTRTMLRTAVTDTTGQPVNNFELRDADEITVFSTTDYRPNRYITISGAVHKSGRIPYRDGMTMRDAVLIANGLQEGALLTDAEIARLPENRAGGQTAITIDVPLDSTYLFERGANGRYLGPPGIAAPTTRAPEVLLQPYDAILIKRQPDWGLQRSVTILGEVKSPGQYSLTTKTEKLSDLIHRAGGLTSSAYAGGITFYRLRGDVGRVGVDLERVLRDTTFIDNVQLVDGDSIVIPTYTPVVAVHGAVYSPSGVPYVPGERLGHYVRAAGGANVKGDASRAYVVQPTGKVEAQRRHWLFFHWEPAPQPGAVVVVPERDPNEHTDWTAVATAATSILGSLVAIAAIVKH